MDVAVKLEPKQQRNNNQGGGGGPQGVPPPNKQQVGAGPGPDDIKPFNQQGGGGGQNRRGGIGGRGGRGGPGGGGPSRFNGGGRGGGGPNQNFNRGGNRPNVNQDANDSIVSGVSNNSLNNADISMGGGPPQPGGGNNNNNQNQNDQQQQQQFQRNHNKGMNNRNQRNGGGGEEFLISQKLSHIQGPTHDLPSIKYEEIKFSGRNRLYIGNLTSDVTEEELKDLFKPYGETSEVFLNVEKFFAFIKIDYRANAEKAKRELDGYMRTNRALRVRFAPNATTVRIKNLTAQVSNELLHKSFEIFGQVERAVIIVDDRGKPTGEGHVEFTRKSGAMAAIRYCTEKCYFLTSSLRPCVCDLFDHSDDTDGLPEKTLGKKNQDYYNARNMGPRFADFNSFEHEYGTRWKQLHELYKKKHEALNTEMQMEEDKLEAQMEYARYEHETEMLRNQLRMREADRDQVKNNWEMKEKFADEQRIKSEEQMRRTQEEMAQRMGKQEEELRRRQQENTLFMQAQQLNSMLDAQEMNQGPGPNNMGVGGPIPGNLANNMGVGPINDMPLGGPGGNVGPVNCGPNGPQGGPNNNQRKNFNQGGGPGNRNFNQGPNNMNNQDDGGFNNFGGPNNNNRGNHGGGRGGGGRPWNNNNNNNQQQNDGGNFGGNNKRRRF